MRSKLIAIIAAAAVIVSGGIWYFASPSYAMMQLRDAALEGNADELGDSIDFPAVRESLKADLRAELAKEVVNDDGEGLRSFGSMIAMAMVDGLVEGFVTPESLEAMIKNGHFKDPEKPDSAAADQLADWSIERTGFSRFTATPDAPDGGKVPSLIFERDGLSWKLIRIKLSDGGLGAPET